MKYSGCRWIEHSIVLDHLNVVRHCNNHNPVFGGRPVIYDNYMGDFFNPSDLFAKKRALRNIFKSGTCPECCTDCVMFEEKEWDDDDYINFVLLTPWVECNSGCVYCSSPRDKYVLENTVMYDVYSVIKNMIDNNMFSPDAVFDFAGGEPTMFYQFDHLLKLLGDNGFKNIVIHTNAINYSDTVNRLVSEGSCKVLVSLDSGTDEMYRKIKQTGYFVQVKSNLKKYADAQTSKLNAVRSKYIIVPGINDSEKDISDWLDLCSEIGINSVILNLDFNWLSENADYCYRMKNLPYSEDNICLKLYNLIDYTHTEATKRNIKSSLYGEIFAIKTIVEGVVTENKVDD